MYCKRCGTPLHTGVVICPECGARQRRQASSVRCASCHTRVPVTLSLCPRCGRDVRPAGPRWGLWLGVALALMAMVLWGLNKLPVEQVARDVIGIKAKVSGLVQVLGPAPTADQPKRTPQAIARATATSAPTTAAVGEQPGAETEAELVVSEAGINEATPELLSTDAAQTPSAQPITATVTAVSTLAPSSTPTASPTATATAIPPTATQPAPTATTAAAQPAGSQANTYRVRAGDTLSGIATQFKVSLDALLAANRIPATATLRIGQELVIPGAGVPPKPAATPRPQATATPAPPTATPAPYLPVPALSGPGDKASNTGDKAIYLKWDAVPGMSADDRYQVIIRWIEQGAPQEWSHLLTGTEIQAPPWLWGRADQPERRYQWFIRAVRSTTDGQGGELVIPLSPASEIRTFYWN